MEILPGGVIKRRQQEMDGTISEEPGSDYHPIRSGVDFHKSVVSSNFCILLEASRYVTEKHLS